MMGANGKTQQKLKSALKYPNGYSTENIVKNYEILHKTALRTSGMEVGEWMKIMRESKFIYLIASSKQNVCDEKLFHQKIV